MNILLVGCYGKLASAIIKACSGKEDMNIACGVDLSVKDNPHFPVFTAANDIPSSMDIDAVIDCSHPSGAVSTVRFCKKYKKPLVYATTGLDKEQMNLLHELSKHVAVFQSANMSLGVNLLIKLCKQAATFLGNDFDIEIIEKHHNQKIDAPSGTALKIADEINQSLNNQMTYVYDRQSKREKRDKKEIGIHAVRGGNIVGQHEVIFAGQDETITISHGAFSKDIFAQGALRAVLFIKDKPAGLYGMDDLL
ncbi:MAG TPA: 4-hydroxy-tetrahydrodipicolinate reductase [Clostridia bacterium]|jgi:4-hydroxy-tetrahydrodipicolinate reductase|nr:4-hydroxy-tetrahydrodipicolinate reductase [Clostridiaceae bacterium]HOM34657.1 4-hydroxy-tetrahydrodipicolinate reductase [Clostridia bacterium]HOR89281.1 4-hydroxy-tetrahydrodipicolinate reductase [Clostridia bacterium]HOT70666.1 4-hydroxy-tetrahydrodipicolinate reductase [Clostridia bacterium]HPL07333.1 4-hydroxy-tetrahydrodipicolinate reductase [Clostridia bacterium]